MFQELIGKKVKCRDVGVLMCMFPNFRLIKDESFKYSDTPFIYIGPSINIRNVEKSLVPHIIVNASSEYDLDDRNTLLQLACKKNNIKVSIDTEILYLLSWEEFLRIWKILWVTGIFDVKVTTQINLLAKVLKNLDYPYIILMEYLKNENILNIEEFQNELLLFINNCINNVSTSLKMENLQKKFLKLYGKNIHYAVKNYLESPIDNPNLRTSLFLMDLLGIKGSK